MTTITTWGPEGFTSYIYGKINVAVVPHDQARKLKYDTQDDVTELCRVNNAYSSILPLRLIHIESPSDPPCDTENG